MKLRSTVITALTILAPAMAHAGLNGDNVTVNYGGVSFYSPGMPGAAAAVIGSGLEFSQSFTDQSGQIWTVNSDFSDSTLKISWTESTRADNSGNYFGGDDLFTIGYSFASSPINSVHLVNLTPTSYGWPSFITDTNQSYLKVITVNGSSGFQLQFSRLLSGETYDVAISAVPEPETYAMLMAGLGVMGAVARRRKNKQA